MSTEKKIVDYLHLYGTGIDIMTPDGKGTLLSIYPKGIEVGLHIIKQGQIMKGRYSTAGMHYFYNYEDCQPLLSKLEDMPDEVIREFIHFESLKKMYSDVSYELERAGITIYYTTDVANEAPCPQSFTIFFNALTPAQFHFLLMRGYDLFGLAESGLAIDKKTLK